MKKMLTILALLIFCAVGLIKLLDFTKSNNKNFSLKKELVQRNLLASEEGDDPGQSDVVCCS